MELGRAAFRQSVWSLVMTLSIVALGVTLPWMATRDAGGTDTATGGSVVRVRTIGCGWERVGSGVVTDDGVLTNRHVVAGASSIVIEFVDGSEHGVASVRDGGMLDLSVLALEPSTDRPVPAAAIAAWAETPARVGDAVTVRGFPGGGALREQRGTVSAEIRGEVAPDPSRLWALDVAVRPGSSGSGVFASSGELVGLVYAAAHSDDGALVMRGPDIRDAVATAPLTPLVRCAD